MPPEDLTGVDFADAYWRKVAPTELTLAAVVAACPDEAELRLLTENLPALCWIADGDGSIGWYNRRWHDYCGSTPEAMSGWGWRAVHDPAILPAVMERWTSSIATGEAFEMTFPLKGADGVFRPFLTRITPLRNADGKVVRWFGTNTDVTAQHKAEAALAASEAEFRTFAQAMPNQVWAAQPDGSLDWFNQQVYEYSGLAPGTLDGTGWTVMVHPDDLAVASAKWSKSLATGVHYEAEFRLRRADGAYRWHISRALPIWNAERVITRWIGTNTDIEDHKSTAAALVSLNATLEQEVARRTADRDRVWRNSQDLIIIVDSAGVFRAVSPSVTSILGYAPEEWIGRSLFDFVVPEDVAPTMAVLNRVADQALQGFVNRYRHRDGGVRYLSWVSTVEDGLIYASARDVTGERAAAAELANAQEALRQSQKMEAVGQLTGGIAHDFNNMLAVVMGSLELLARRVPEEDARARRYIDAATDAARRAALLTQRLLAFSRQQPLQPEAIDANKLVAGMSDLLRHSLGADVQLETVLAGGLWRTHADPNQLENILLNLAVNARDAMPDGGHLTIETQNAHLDERYAAANLGVTAGQYVLIAVTDTGSGMPPEVVEKAFDPFFTTKPVGKGTGLGLSQVYGFIKQSGGHVKIYTEQGLGTTIKLYLPRLLGGAQDDQARAAAHELARGDDREVILVVEDEPGVRQFSVDALTELGYHVLEAESAARALRVLEEHPEIVLMFTDVVMPEMNGAKLAEAARVLRPDLKILFTTGYTRNAVVHNGTLDEGVDLIGKPFSLEALAAKIRTVLEAR
ncbi:PAS domain-containing protein [Sphingomonas sp. MMS24-J45]|uniref:PAS domain-containing protein n=1 Tax=Sphingomonas sp. MMS24-J45 TaxID=3238806 RepID=UPI00384CE96D